MDTLLLEQERDALGEHAWDVPTGIPTHQPGQAEPGAEHVWPEVPGNEQPTYLHPAVLIGATAGYAWFLIVSWVVFSGYGYMGLALTVATLISGAMLGLMAGGGAGGRNVTPGQRPWKSFREFLAGEVEVWDARVSGWDAFVQLVGMAWCLGGLATAFGIITMLARP